MREYVIMIVGAALVGTMADIISPEAWRKYVSLISGFVIIGCIVSPAAKIMKSDIFGGFDRQIETVDYEKIQLQKVTEETERRISADIKDRIKQEFGKDAEVQTVLKINRDNKIEKIEKITIHLKPDSLITKRMCEVYGINEDEVEYE